MTNPPAQLGDAARGPRSSVVPPSSRRLLSIGGLVSGLERPSARTRQAPSASSCIAILRRQRLRLAASSQARSRRRSARSPSA